MRGSGGRVGGAAGRRAMRRTAALVGPVGTIGWRRGAIAAALLLLALSSTACGGLFARYDRAPNGLLRTDWELRRALIEGNPDTSLLRVDASAKALPDDELLRALYQGLLAHYAGEASLSAERLGAADALAEERYTKSLTRSALSLIASDLSLPYEPVEAERLLVHYFGALSWIRLGALDEAAVEARRLSFLLDRYDESAPSRSGGLRPFLRTFAGTVFEAAGEWNDAAVAYRKAAAYEGTPADSVPFPEPATGGRGEVIVLVERGFVAHQVEEGVILSLSGEQAERLTAGDADDRAGLAAAIAARALLHVAAQPRPGDRWATGGRTAFIDLSDEDWDEDDPRCDPSLADSWRAGARDTSGTRVVATTVGTDRCTESRRRPEKKDEKDDAEEDDDNPYLLRLAWPAFRQDRPGPTPLAVRPDGLDGIRFSARADLSDAVRDGYEDRREWMLARMIVRATAKLALTRTVEREVGEKDETIGKIVGFLTNAGTALLEQADTRSLHLLPAGVSMARITLPPGTHVLRLEVADGLGGTRIVELPPVEVRGGELSFLMTRLWS